MKTNNYLIFTLALYASLALCLLSCTKEPISPHHLDSERIMQTITINANISIDEETKTQLGDVILEDAKKYRKVTWSSGDKIGVVANVEGTESTFEFTLISEEGQVSGKFSGSIPADANIIKAVYPYIGDSFPNIKTEQIPTLGSFDKRFAFMEGTHSGDKNFVFTHKASYLKITTTFDCRAITVKSTYTDIKLIDMIINNNRVTSPSVSMRASNIPAGEYYIVVGPKFNLRYGFSVEFLNSTGTFYKGSINKFENTKEGTIINLGTFNFNELEPLTTNLSTSQGRANSYIVSYPGKYKFQTVKAETYTSVGKVASAEVLWESYGTSTTPQIGDLVSNVRYENNYIYFEAKDVRGNALIAAKDASGTILWSWHIWMTEWPKDQKYNNTSRRVMDRNLGATSATPGDNGSIGLMYQWGRKDPFLGPSTLAYPTAPKAQSTLNWPEPVEKSTTTGTIEYAQAHPTTFIKSSAFPYDWLYTADDELWRGTTKRLYDPCPYGYRVVGDSKTKDLWATSFGYNYGWITKTNWNSNNFGMDFSQTDKTLGIDGPIWYPASGHYHYLGYIYPNVGQVAVYWSAEPTINYAMSFLFNADGEVIPKETSGRSLGCPVRCYREY